MMASIFKSRAGAPVREEPERETPVEKADLQNEPLVRLREVVKVYTSAAGSFMAVNQRSTVFSVNHGLG